MKSKKHNIFSRRHRQCMGAAVIALAATVAMAAPPPSLSLTSPGAEGWMLRADEMLGSGNYAGTIDQLRHYLDNNDGISATLPQRQEGILMLLEAYSASDMEREFKSLYAKLQAEYPLDPASVRASLLDADFLFFDNKYDRAAEAYGRQNINLLPPSLSQRYTYRYAMSLLRSGKSAEAKPLFSSLVHDDDYASTARFYLGYIDWLEGNHNAANQHFAKVAEPVASQLGVSFYEAQILFSQGRYDTIVSRRGQYLTQIAKVTSEKYAMTTELNRIIGESYFALGQRQDAYPYLMRYITASGNKALPSALYEAAVIQYNNTHRDEAYALFARVVEQQSDTPIAQSSYLYMGQCAAAKADYSAAAMAFEKAARMTANPKVAETALYDFAVASAKGGRVPFGASTAAMLEQFTDKYPNSQYTADIEQYLATAYFNDRDYARALQRINRIAHPDAKALYARQNILYNLGAQELATASYAAAENHLRQAAEMISTDRVLAARSSFLLGDAFYQQQRYAEAVKAYDTYLTNAHKNDSDRTLALYDKAYALYRQKKFNDALNVFTQCASSSPRLDTRTQADTQLRIADCQYYTGKIGAALKSYASQAEKYPEVADYALFQQANMQGINGNQQAKISGLQSMISRYPTSPLIPDALLELTNAYLATGNQQAASATSAQLKTQYPASEQLRQSELQIASSLLEADKLQEAADVYRRIIRSWPTSRQAATAADDLRSIAARTGEIAAYAEFINSVPGAPRPDADQMEKLAFEAAEKRLVDSPYDIELFRKYLAVYPAGKYVPHAWLYIAESQSAAGHLEDAIIATDNILSLSPDGECAPAARKIKGEALQKQRDTTAAHAVWSQLLNTGGAEWRATALAGLASTAPGDAETLRYISELNRVSPSDLTDALRLRYAKALSGTGDTISAERELLLLSDNPNTPEGAEAAVILGELHLNQGNPDAALKTLTRFTDRGTPHQYWLARGFIALSDAYAAKGDKTTAREYLRSLKANYPGSETDISDMINSRLK